MNALSSDLMLMSVMQRFMRFAAVGAVATVAHYSVLYCFVSLLGVPVLLATTCGFAVGALVSYRLNRHFTFQSRASHRRALSKFMTVAICGAGLNAGIVASLIAALHWHYLLIQMLATGCVLLWNFTANALWTFRHS